MIICGGGVAAVETLLAVRALLAVGIELHLVAPNRQFVYQLLAVAAPDLALTFADLDGADGRFDSALQWLEVVERLDGVLPAGYLVKRARWQQSRH